MTTEQKPFDNAERRRYYGVRIGDRVKATNGRIGTVAGYGFMDNNCVHVEFDGAKKGPWPYVAESLEIVIKVEDIK